MSNSKSAGTGQPTNAAKRLSAQRAAAARERIAASQRRRRMTVVASAVLAVVVVVVALVLVKVTTDSGGPKSGKSATPAAAGVLAKVASVPAATLDAVGTGTAQTPPAPIDGGSALTDGGKPEVLYIGAEYCPYCAAERWAVAVALSRFGTLHDVGQTASSAQDVYPSTQTLSFHGATYSSSSLSLTAKEIQSNKVVNGQYAPLDTLTSAQQGVVDKYNAPPYVKSKGSIPFVDLGGRYVISGASYDPQVLQGKTHAQIADALSDANSPIAQSIDGTANLITAALCKSTNGQPGSVCSSKGVTTAAAKLGGSG